MITYNNIVEQILIVVKEAKDKNYSDFILKYDINKIIEREMMNSAHELEQAYLDGRDSCDEDQYELGRQDGYEEGKRIAINELKEKFESHLFEFESSFLDSIDTY